MESGELRRASMPIMPVTTIRPPPDGEEADALDSSAYDAEIKNLQKTLKDLGIGRPSDGCAPDVRPKQRSDFLPKTSAANRQSRSRAKTVDQSEDYVPDYLVSPYMRPKAKGHLRVKDDVEDTGIVSPRLGSRRRQSDPGRLSGAALSSLQSRYSGMSSDSSEDEEAGTELRSPRARSPRRIFSSVPEDECFPSPVATQSSGKGSPRRRLLQSRHAQSLCHQEESPRLRRNRSNSLPLPDRTLLGIGEAMGALVHGGPDSGQHRQQMLKRSRCISIEESPLEAILEEAGGQRSVRRFSVPANISNAATKRLHLPKEC